VFAFLTTPTALFCYPVNMGRFALLTKNMFLCPLLHEKLFTALLITVIGEKFHYIHNTFVSPNILKILVKPNNG
jgi:hypothetical protein